MDFDVFVFFVVVCVDRPDCVERGLRVEFFFEIMAFLDVTWRQRINNKK